jgi:hypothetical protein
VLQFPFDHPFFLFEEVDPICEVMLTLFEQVILNVVYDYEEDNFSTLRLTLSYCVKFVNW